MSLPEDLRDQLLTGYLDDALSADERTRVEQLLQSDATFADELAQLRELRQSLRSLAVADAAIQLEGGFSDRVLDAAVARARSEGLAEDHPLVRLAEEPSTKPLTTTGYPSSWRFAGVLIGLAASIAIAVIALRPDPRQPEGIAAVDTQSEIAVPDEVLVPKLVEDPGANTAEMIATSDPPAVSPQSPDEPVVVEPNPEQRPTPTIEMVAESKPASSDAVDVPELRLENLDSPIGAILVLDVRRTESGRQSNAVEEAMKQAEIELPSKLQITDEIAGFVDAQRDAAPADVSVLYLQVQGKSFEKFYNGLWADRSGIASVRMALSLDVPLMKAVNAVRPDPKTIRGDNRVFELISDNGAVDKFANQLGQLHFPPMGNRDQLPALPALPQREGDDIQAQVLLLVR